MPFALFLFIQRGIFVNIEERIIQLMDDFIANCDNAILISTSINSIEIYNKSHAFLDILQLMEEKEQTILLKNKLISITETILELDK